jgi:hypothetical protein
VRGTAVEFAHSIPPQEVFRDRITAGDVRWAGHLLARLTDRQWRDAFRAGGYVPELADRFIPEDPREHRGSTRDRQYRRMVTSLFRHHRIQ